VEVIIMTLVKWEPLRDLEGLFDRYSKGMDWPYGAGQGLTATGDWTPRVDISETDKEFIIKAEIPDVNKDDVKVDVDNGILTIQGERKQEKEETGEKFHRVERYYGSFVRSFGLPENVDENKIDASFKDGMLNLRMKKTAETKHKKIEVKVH